MTQRRDFIKQLGLGSIGLSIAPSLAFKHTVPFLTDKKSLRILFQGDSITDGGRWPDSNDWNHLVGQSYPYLISAKLGFDYPNRDLQFFNRGVSGNTVTDLKTRWQKDCLALKPDILSVLVGINDVNAVIHDRPGAGTVNSFESDYREILQQARALNPQLAIILCDPFVFPQAAITASFEKYTLELNQRQEVVQRLAVEFKAIHLPLWTAFKKAIKLAPISHWCWDGVHPMPVGHELIARAWIKATSKSLGIQSGVEY